MAPWWWSLHIFLLSKGMRARGDYLYMSCHSNPNIIVYDVNTSTLYTKTLLDTSAIDWIPSKDVNFRGMAISDDILYVANAKKSASFIGKWRCRNGGSNVDEKSDGLAFVGNFTGVRCLLLTESG